MAATIVLQPEREKSIKRRHPWIFAGAVASLKGRARKGDTVEVVSAKGEWLARGAYSPDSQIRVRIWTFNQQESIDNAFFCANARKNSQKKKKRKNKLCYKSSTYKLISVKG